MTKKLLIAAAFLSMSAGAFAQDYKSGNIQASLLLGNSMTFDQDLNYVLPKYGNDNMGIGNNYGVESDDPGIYLNFNDLGDGNMVNIAGLQFHY